jgi:predicted short-subunit dehydrogenase-like oxidoreductase (DUF2520 family)
MRRTIENGFELTGPIARGDWTTVDRHLDAIGESGPIDDLYRALGSATAELSGRTPPSNSLLLASQSRQ